MSFRLYVKYCGVVALLLLSCIAKAQDDAEVKAMLMHDIVALTDTAMHGRGYVKDGRITASNYLQKRFAEVGLKPVGRKSTFAQHYSFPVNTFPGAMSVSLNGQKLQAGVDYIVDAASKSYVGSNRKIKTIDLAKVKSTTDWEDLYGKMGRNEIIYYLKNVDEAIKVVDLNKNKLIWELPGGCYIISQKEKFIWTVAGEQSKNTLIYVKEDVMVDTGVMSVDVQADFKDDIDNQNIIGYVPGEDVVDSYLVITAHYDHLGMMGKEAIFPGASDNASGTAMLLYLAQYFVAHPQKYSILFIAFSGEEAGLRGSKYFVKHPLVPLDRIKFLTNVDIMGDATDGVTVVNATEHPKMFVQIQQINKEKQYLPQVKSRGKAANSDHYYFSEAGVPAFFLYSNGGIGYYHDVFDKAATLSLQNIPNVAAMLIDFVSSIK